jgi:hypothetical protein
MPATPVGAAVVQLTPSKDNTLIESTNPLGQLSNGQGDLFAGRTGQAVGLSIRRGLIAFDVAGSIPVGSSITRVTLTVNDVQGLNGNQTVSLHRLFQNWGEGSSFFSGGQGAAAENNDATWLYTFYDKANPGASPTWDTPGGSYASVASASVLITAGSGNRPFAWSSDNSPSLRTDVQNWLDQPETAFGWIMLGNETVAQTAKRFSGSEATNSAYWPKLTIEYTAVPEPSTLSLVLMGAIVVFGACRHRARAGRARAQSQVDGPTPCA